MTIHISLKALVGGVFLLAIIGAVVVAVVLTQGGGNGGEPVRIIPTQRIVFPTPTVSPLLEFTECVLIAEIRGFDLAVMRAILEAANQDGTVSAAEAIFLRDLCNEAIGR